MQKVAPVQIQPKSLSVVLTAQKQPIGYSSPRASLFWHLRFWGKKKKNKQISLVFIATRSSALQMNMDIMEYAPLQQRRSAAFWVALGVLLAGQGK